MSDKRPPTPTATASTKECVSLRNRMLSRMAEGPIGPTRDEADLIPPVLNLDISSDNVAKSGAHRGCGGGSGGDANLSRDSLGGRDGQHHHHTYATATATASAATALRERVDARGRTSSPSPLAGFHERTKDTYAYESSFPVRTTLEMERVAAPSAGLGHSDTLLMASESAAVVRTLENQLFRERQRGDQMERKLVELQKAADGNSADAEDKAKQINALAVRNDELSKQLELLRKECQLALEKKHKEHEDAKAAALKANDDQWNAQMKQVKGELATQGSHSKASEGEKAVLSALVAELREQLSLSAATLQNHTLTIRQMSNDLLAAKSQASNLSVGLQQKERQAREAKAELHANLAEMARVREIAAQAAKDKDAKAKLEAQLKEATAQLEMLKGADEEIQRSRQVLAKMEYDMGQKDIELQRLRGQVDVVRQQADAAYIHTSQFRGEQQQQQGGGLGVGGAGAGGGGSFYDPTAHSGSGGYGGNNRQQQQHGGGGHSALAQLQNEIAEEERRTMEESRQWRQKQSSRR